jgi:hypothetical protein
MNYKKLIKTKYYAAIIILLLQFDLLSAGENSMTGNKYCTFPTLGNHRFVVNHHIRDPFMKTYIRNTLGMGRAFSMEIPILEIDGKTIRGVRGDLLFLTLEFEYQYAVKHWLAMYGKFQVLGRLGNGMQALLAQGVTMSIDFELGWMFKILQTKTSMVSGTLNLINSSGTFIDIYDFIQKIIEEGGITPDNELVQSRPFLRGGGGLRYARALTTMVGLILSSELAYGESVDRRIENKLYYNLGVSFDLDIKRKTGVPMGFVLGYKLDSFPSGGDKSIGNVNLTLLRIAYIGREDFLLSLDLSWIRLPLLRTNQNLDGSSASVNMKYFF